VRGDILRLQAPRDALGHEQAGPRYAVVVQSDALLLSTLLVAPTSTSARPASFRPEIEIEGTLTRVLVEQTAAIDLERRKADFAGRLEPEEIADMERALAEVFGLDTASTEF